MHTYEQMRDEIERLRAEIAEAQRDARRYRWLRDPQRLVEASTDEGAGDVSWFIGENSSVRWGVAEEDADAAIDAAMANDATSKDAECANCGCSLPIGCDGVFADQSDCMLNNAGTAKGGA